MVSYPLTLPTSPKLVSDNFHIQRNQTGIPANNGVVQILTKPGDKWVGNCTLPPMTAAQAADWMGFFDALEGMVGNFTMEHPNYAAMQGTASGETGAIMGASQTGKDIATDGWSAGATFKRGDLVQIGATGAQCRLKRIVADATANGSGQVTLTVHPPVYTAHADNTAIYTENCKGYFRLASPDVPAPADRNKLHNISFAVEEVLP